MSESKEENVETLQAVGGEVLYPFPVEEYKIRLKRIRLLMEESNIDMLYLTSPESMNYVSGYDVAWHRVNAPREWYDSQAAGIAVHTDHDKFIHYDLPDEEIPIRQNSVASDMRIFSEDPVMMYGKDYVFPSEGENYIDLVVKDLVSEGWARGRIGLELGSYRPNSLVFQEIKEKLERAGCEVVDGTDLVRKVRGIKSPLEMQYIETATKITDVGMKAIQDTLRAGMTELDVVAVYTKAMCEVGGEYPGIVNMVRSGNQRCWGFHFPASTRKIMPGDPVGIDLAGVYKRYHSNQCRYFNVAEPNEEFEKLYAVNAEIMSIVEATIKPNLLVSDFLKELKKYYIDQGLLGKQYWIGGYELGIAYPPDWVGAFVYDIYLDIENGTKKFVPGTVVNFETGFGVIDTLIFKEKRAIILGSTPWELQIV